MKKKLNKIKKVIENLDEDEREFKKWTKPTFKYKGKTYKKFTYGQLYELSQLKPSEQSKAMMELSKKKGLAPYTPLKDVEEILNRMCGNE